MKSAFFLLAAMAWAIPAVAADNGDLEAARKQYIPYRDLPFSSLSHHPLDLVRRLAETGFAPAEDELGRRYAAGVPGIGAPPNLAEAEAWLRKAVAASTSPAYARDLACVLYAAPDHRQESAGFMAHAYDGGDASGGIYFSRLVRAGIGVPADQARADAIVEDTVKRTLASRRDRKKDDLMKFARDTNCAPADAFVVGRVTVAMEKYHDNRPQPPEAMTPESLQPKAP